MITRSDTEFEKFDHCCKVIIVGDSGVGKTSFIQRAVTNKFEESHNVTIIADISRMFYLIGEVKVRLQFWDTCGLEQYRSMNRAYYRNSDIALVLYDLNNLSTLKNCKSIITDVREYCSKDTLIYLIGNKNDLLDDPIQMTEALEICKSYSLNG